MLVYALIAVSAALFLLGMIFLIKGLLTPQKDDSAELTAGIAKLTNELAVNSNVVEELRKESSLLKQGLKQEIENKHVLDQKIDEFRDEIEHLKIEVKIKPEKTEEKADFSQSEHNQYSG